MSTRWERWMTGGLATVLTAVLTPAAMAQNPVTLEMLDPTGSAEVTFLHAPRLPDLEGKGDLRAVSR